MSFNPWVNNTVTAASKYGMIQQAIEKKKREIIPYSVETKEVFSDLKEILNDFSFWHEKEKENCDFEAFSEVKEFLDSEEISKFNSEIQCISTLLGKMKDVKLSYSSTSESQSKGIKIKIDQKAAFLEFLKKINSPFPFPQDNISQLLTNNKEFIKEISSIKGELLQLKHLNKIIENPT